MSELRRNLIPDIMIASRGIVVVPTDPANTLSNFIEQVSKNIVLIRSERVIKQNGGLGLKNNLSHSSVPKIVILAFIIVACIPFSSSAQNPAMKPAIEKLKAGQQFQKNGQYDKAIVNYQQALTLFRKLGMDV